MIELLEGYPDDVVALACKGQVSRDDYRAVLEPAVEAALARNDRLRLLYRVDPDFTGIDPGAMWEDFKVGIEHLTRWERVAVVTDVEWIAHSVRAFGFLIPAEIRVFGLAEADAAKAWITAG